MSLKKRMLTRVMRKVLHRKEVVKWKVTKRGGRQRTKVKLISTGT